jgi:hypothetical protein
VVGWAFHRLRVEGGGGGHFTDFTWWLVVVASHRLRVEGGGGGISQTEG